MREVLSVARSDPVEGHSAKPANVACPAELSRPADDLRHGLIACTGLVGLVCAFAGTDDIVALPMYFTEWSNAAVVVFYGFRRWRRLPAGTSAAICAAVTLYITVTGLVFHFVLAGGANPFILLLDGAGSVPKETGTFLLHYVVPLMAVANWFAFESGGRLRRRHAVVWLASPVVYLAVILIRGACFAVDRYPYPFLDVTRLGYALVARNSAGMAVCFYALGLLYVALDRVPASEWRTRPQRRRNADRAPWAERAGSADLGAGAQSEADARPTTPRHVAHHDQGAVLARRLQLLDPPHDRRGRLP
ncbi:Pr6Pr family membrane protein [Rhizohabitans arisaemae]|uniref:Pr6Pr family membrane protein n=1 Tax=Rhizohabitans arisaemae TaxID=2720610 RepID=UPI0024B10BE6|nr:Pr6Pr family membrane protein [Rhizohabitans arisaemae]